MNQSLNFCCSSKTALVIFAYNRPDHLSALYKVLENYDLSKKFCLHIFHDGPKSKMTSEIMAARKLSLNFAQIFENSTLVFESENHGLARSIRKGLDFIFSKHDQAIILEDDLIPNRDFFILMEQALKKEKNNLVIGSITGSNTTKFPWFIRDSFLLSHRHCSWGWATWADRWHGIDWKYVEIYFQQNLALIHKVKKVSPDLVRYAQLQREGKIDSWATYLNIDFINRNLMCIVPRKSLIRNIGFDGSGTHSLSSRVKHEVLNEPPIHQVSFSEEINIRENSIYNFLVWKDNSLLRDFPKGAIIRILVKLNKLLK